MGALTLNEVVEPIVVNVAQFDKVNGEYYTLVWTIKGLLLISTLTQPHIISPSSRPNINP